MILPAFQRLNWHQQPYDFITAFKLNESQAASNNSQKIEKLLQISSLVLNILLNEELKRQYLKISQENINKMGFYGKNYIVPFNFFSRGKI